MANPKAARKKLRDFLLIENGDSIAMKIARARVKQDKLTCTPTQYIANNRAEIKQLVLETVEKQAEKIIPERYWWYVLKQFGVVTFLLVPAVYSLTEYAFHLYLQPEVDIARLAACAVSIVFISVLLIGFASSFFKLNE